MGGDAVEMSIEAGTDPSRVVSVVDAGVRDAGGQYVFMTVKPKDLTTWRTWSSPAS